MAVKKKADEIENTDTQNTILETNQEDSTKSSSEGSIEVWGQKILQAIQAIPGLTSTSNQTQTTQTPIQMELPKIQKEKEDPIKKETKSFLSKIVSFF